MAVDLSYVPSTNERGKSRERARLKEALNFAEYQKIRTFSYDIAPLECAIDRRSTGIRNKREDEKVDSGEQFSWLQKCLDLAVSWRDPLRTIRGRLWDVDWAMEESIKYTIKYLLDDGLLGCFVNSIVLNNRLERICRELDSLGFQSNVFANLYLSGSDNGKNNGLLPRRRKRRGKRKRLIKGRDDRDHPAEVGLGSMKASAPPTYRHCRRACKRAATYDSPSNEKIDRAERMESCRNREDSQDTFISCEKNADFPTNILLKPDDRNEEEGPSSSSSQRNRLKGERERISRSTLKLIIRKARSLDCSSSISLKPIKSCRLSLPCKADDVTKEIFKADPGLHESCLIVMKRKFEMGVYNFCSCLNDVLRRLNDQNITELRLILEIRPGYINFKLIGKKDHESRSCLFADRVPICQSVHKRDVVRIVDNSIDYNEVSSFNEFCDTFNDPVATSDVKNTNEENCEKLRLSFFSRCSDASSTEVKRTLVDGKIDMAEEEETQLPLDFSVTNRSKEEDKACSSASRINDDTTMSRKDNEDVIETLYLSLEIDHECREDNEDFLTCQTGEKRFDVDEGIKLNSTVECSCCSFCGTPILSSKTEEDINISRVEQEILDLIKNFIEEIEEKIYITKIENIPINNEDILVTVKEDTEESVSCDCSMSLDSLMTRKSCQEEINTDRDSRCSCRSYLEDKLPNRIPNEIERIDTPKTKDNFDIPLLDDILKNDDETSCPMTIKNNEKIVCDRKDFVSLSIQTSRTRTLSKFTDLPKIEKSKTVVLAKTWSKAKWTRKVDDGTTRSEERKRDKRSKIWKLRGKGSSRKKVGEVVPSKKSKRSSLPTEKRSICTCNVAKRSGYRGRRRFKDESWTSRLKNYVSFRPSNFLSTSFCESFHSGKKSIGRLRNLVRAKLRRLMSSNGRNENDRSEKKTDEIKRSDSVYRRRKVGNDERIVEENSNDFCSRKVERRCSIMKDKTRIREKDNRRSSCDRDSRCSKERRSITKADRKLSICDDCACSSSSNDQRLTRRSTESEKVRKKLSREKANGKKLEIRFDRAFWDEKTDRSMDEYEKSICDLSLDFRSKLEQYVALCKNIKYSLLGSGK